MPTVAFDNWVTEALVVTLAGREYKIAPPSVEQAKDLLVLYKQLFATKLTDDEQVIMERIGNLSMEQAGLPPDVYAQFCADGVPKDTITRVSIYNVLYFVGNKNMADSFANTLWAKIQSADKAKAKGGAVPKGKRTSTKRTGTPTGSVSKTPTRASTKTTGSQRTSNAPTKTAVPGKTTSSRGGRTGPKSSSAGTPSKLTS